MRKWLWGMSLVVVAWAAAPGNFAWDSTQKVADRDSSLVYSPLSARQTLRLLYDGGALELATLCQFQPKETPAPARGWSAAQAVFLGAGVSEPTGYPAAVKALNFGKPTACREINEWVSQQTQGRVKELLRPQELPADTALVAVSAVYLKSIWLNPFDPKNTEVQPFYPKGTVQMMSQSNNFSLHHEADFTMLEMPYRDSQLVFDCCLPVREDGLAAVRRNLSAATLESVWNQLEEARVQVFLPKFHLQSRHNLLTSLSIPSTISLPAFSIGLTRVDVLVQQADVELDEFGTVASAATAAVVARGLPEVFKADHPFLFWIRDKSSGTVIFSGQFCGN